jgi:hypothetical protein
MKIVVRKPSSTAVCDSNADPEGDASGKSFCSSNGSNSLTQNHTYNRTFINKTETEGLHFTFTAYALIKTNLKLWK